MQQWGSFWVLMAVILVVGVITTVVGLVAAKKRREEMARFAANRGWTYLEQDQQLLGRFTGPPFERGFARRAHNVIHGQHDGRAFVSFDYQYKTRSGSGKNRSTTTHRLSVMALSMGAVDMPELYVRPQGLMSRVVDAIVDNDIELESEDFNRAFAVTCSDRKFASDVLHPQLMEFMLERPQLGWRLKGDSMLAIASGTRTLAQIDSALVLMDTIADQVPEFVWVRLRGHG